MLLRSPGVVEAGGTASYHWIPAAGTRGGVHALRGTNFHSHHPPHLHPTYVIGVIDRGGLVVSRDGEDFIAREGAVVLLSPYQVHEERSLGPSGRSFRYLYPTPAFIASFLGIGPVEFPIPVIDDERLGRGIARVFESIELDVSDLLRQVLTRHGRSRGEVRVRGTRRQVERARTFLIQADARSLTLGGVADIAGMSRSHFCREFHQQVGLPPYAYYEELRVGRAREMLHAGQSVSSVAFQLGYADQSHFTRHFRRTVAVTPGVYGRMVKHALALTRAVIDTSRNNMVQLGGPQELS